MNDEYVHRCRLSISPGRLPPDWNLIGAWVIEMFGLPGGAWIYKPSSRYLEFRFRDPQHAMTFMLRYGQAEYQDSTPETQV